MARKLYLFGIGGTGSRIIKAFTLLMASGCKLKNDFDVVIPFIIDPDSSNGDFRRTSEILKLYQQIRNQVFQPNDFFAQEIKNLNTLANKSSQMSIDDFHFEIEDVDQNTFGQYIGFDALDDNYGDGMDDRSFARLLYSERNLSSNLNVGFKGNPNMGSVVLNQLAEADDFKRFAETFNDDDAIFIVSSIFGGTGAAGFPLLLKNLRNKDSELPNIAKISSAPIGAITYLPYFALNAQDEINSNSFEDKAKIAIDYYNRTIIKPNKVDSLYLVGNRGNTEHLEYAVGGKDQRNKAHFLEMVGALAIFDFCEHIDQRDEQTCVKEFGIENETENIVFGDLNIANQREIARTMTKYKLFAEYLNVGLKRSLDVSPWTKSSTGMIFKVGSKN